jgi:hypothetical protein
MSAAPQRGPRESASDASSAARASHMDEEDGGGVAGGGGKQRDHAQLQLDHEKLQREHERLLQALRELAGGGASGASSRRASADGEGEGAPKSRKRGARDSAGAASSSSSSGNVSEDDEEEEDVLSAPGAFADPDRVARFAMDALVTFPATMDPTWKDNPDVTKLLGLGIAGMFAATVGPLEEQLGATAERLDRRGIIVPLPEEMKSRKGEHVAAAASAAAAAAASSPQAPASAASSSPAASSSAMAVEAPAAPASSASLGGAAAGASFGPPEDIDGWCASSPVALFILFSTDSSRGTSPPPTTSPDSFWPWTRATQGSAPISTPS